MNDEQIIHLFFARSEQAISEVREKYGNYCHRIAFRVLQNYEDSEECVNDTFLQAWNVIPPQKPNILSSFLGKITRNLALNKLKYNTAQKRDTGHIAVMLEELADCLPAKDNTEAIAEENFVIDCLNTFLSAQKLKTRKIFMRRYWYMDSIKEIAKDFGISESSVKMILSRTRNALKSFLEKEGVSV